jgi:hypothetical protein
MTYQGGAAEGNLASASAADARPQAATGISCAERRTDRAVAVRAADAAGTALTPEERNILRHRLGLALCRNDRRGSSGFGR